MIELRNDVNFNFLLDCAFIVRSMEAPQEQKALDMSLVVIEGVVEGGEMR
jgi:hypothetical protein